MSPANNGVEALMAQMRENYLRELPDKFSELESLVLGVGRDDEALESLYRATHSMKGTAGTYGYGLLSNICHNLEDCFCLFREARYQDTEAAVELWLRYIDLLRDAHTRLESATGEYSDSDAALEDLRKSYEVYELRGLLVVESALDLAVIQRAFDGFPVSLVTVHDGLQAMERLLADKFDFYVLGNQLPRLNGPSIVTAIRTNTGLNRNTPCILLSAVTPQLFGRQTDPDFVVTRDSRFIEQLASATGKLMEMIQG
jgi:CheY-like chemotaxis protein/HPt (histidine-containing phosphotransfer) domain-containing protein